MMNPSEDAGDQIYYGGNDGFSACGFTKPGGKGIAQLG